MLSKLSANDLQLAVGCTLAKAAELLPHLVATCNRFEINTPKRLAMFLAQAGHESASFTVTSENLNYSVDGLLTVFPKYFKTKEVAATYARKPEKIANRVYASRMGNADEASGDGWKYRGRGYIQLTGKNNYIAFEKFLGIDIKADDVAQIPLAFLSAGWFWKTNDLNRYSDLGDILWCTKRINGGTHGLVDRTKRYQKALEALSKV